MPMMSEDKLRRLIDTLRYLIVHKAMTCTHAKFGKGMCHACNQEVFGTQCAVDALLYATGDNAGKTVTRSVMEDERVQKEVSEWIARGRK